MASIERESYLLQNLKVDIEISPDLKKLMEQHADIAPTAIKLGLRRVTREGSKQIKAKVRSLGLVKSGTLAKSIRGSTTNTKSYIGTKLWYAHFLEGGTDPHLIKPQKKSGHKYLRLGGYYRPIFAKSVNHPGIKAYKFTETTFNQMQTSGQVNSLFAQGVREAIEVLSK